MPMQRGVAAQPPKHFLPLLLRAWGKRCPSIVSLPAAPLACLLPCVALSVHQHMLVARALCCCLLGEGLQGFFRAPLIVSADICLLAIDRELLVVCFAVLGYLAVFGRVSTLLGVDMIGVVA